MSRERYIAALIIGAVIFIIGLILAFVVPAFDGCEWVMCVLSYAVATAVINMIWFSGPTIMIAGYGFGIIGIIWRFVLEIFKSGLSQSPCGFVMMCLVIIALPVILSISGTVFVVTVALTLTAGAVTFPVYVFKLGANLD